MAVFDASVVVTLFVYRPWSDLARRHFVEDPNPAAPSLLVVEVANALRSNVRAGFISAEDARESLAGIPSGFRLHLDAPLVAPAFEIAISANHSVYDCLYLALAEHEGIPLVTADRRLSAVADSRGIDAILIGA